MIDLILFFGRILLVVLLYLFLFAAMRSGIGLVRGQRTDAAIWSVDVEKGAKSLRGLPSISWDRSSSAAPLPPIS